MGHTIPDWCPIVGRTGPTCEGLSIAAATRIWPPVWHAWHVRGEGGGKAWQTLRNGTLLPKDKEIEHTVVAEGQAWANKPKRTVNVFFLSSMISDRHAAKANKPTGRNGLHQAEDGSQLGLSDFGHSRSHSHQPGETCSKESLNTGYPVVRLSIHHMVKNVEVFWTNSLLLENDGLWEIYGVSFHSALWDKMCLSSVCVLLEGQHIPPQRIWYIIQGPKCPLSHPAKPNRSLVINSSA